MKANKSSKGFTLVEIMIVVVIIGLLAAMAIPAFQKVRQSSQDKAITNNARQLSAAADQYFLENGVSSVTSANLVSAFYATWTAEGEAGHRRAAAVLRDAAHAAFARIGEQLRAGQSPNEHQIREWIAARLREGPRLVLRSRRVRRRHGAPAFRPRPAPRARAAANAAARRRRGSAAQDGLTPPHR